MQPLDAHTQPSDGHPKALDARTKASYEDCSTLREQLQHAAQAIAARCKQDCTALRESPHPFGGIHSFPSDCRRTLQERRRKQESTAQPTLCEAKRKQEHSTRKSFSQQETPSCPEEKSPSNTKEKGPAAGEDAASPSVGKNLRNAARGCLLAGDKTCGSGN